MDLSTYVDKVTRELAVAADAGGEDARQLAQRLTAPLDSAIRLTLLEALSAAADEITREMAPGSVEVRLRSGEPSFAVTVGAAGRPYEEADDDDHPTHTAPHQELPPDQASSDDGATSRVNLRLPEHLKTRVEEAAAREGRSVNAWLVRAAANALQQPPAASRRLDPRPRAGARSGQRFTGWVR
jgi:hypothetical protein